MGKVKRSTADLVLTMWHWFYKGPQVSSLWSSVYWLPLWAEDKLQCIWEKLTQHCKSKQNCSVGTSLVVQWLRLCLPMQWGMSSIPDWEVKIPHASGCGWKKRPAVEHASPKADWHLLADGKSTVTVCYVRLVPDHRSKVSITVKWDI